MNNNNPTSILASFSTMKSLVDAQQYQSPYQILAEFIQYIIIKYTLHSFTAVEMKTGYLKCLALIFRRLLYGLRLVDCNSLMPKTTFTM